MATIGLSYPSNGGTIPLVFTAYGEYNANGTIIDVLKSMDVAETAAFEKRLTEKGLADKWAALKKDPSAQKELLPAEFICCLTSPTITCTLKRDGMTDISSPVTVECGTQWYANFTAPAYAAGHSVIATLSGGNSKTHNGITTQSGTIADTRPNCGLGDTTSPREAGGTKTLNKTDSPPNFLERLIQGAYARNSRLKSVQAVVFKVVHGYPVMTGIFTGKAQFGQYEIFILVPRGTGLEHYADVLLLDDAGLPLFPASRKTYDLG